jgi:hypothetical protein
MEKYLLEIQSSEDILAVPCVLADASLKITLSIYLKAVIIM